MGLFFLGCFLYLWVSRDVEDVPLNPDCSVNQPLCVLIQGS